MSLEHLGAVLTPGRGSASMTTRPLPMAVTMPVGREELNRIGIDILIFEVLMNSS